MKKRRLLSIFFVALFCFFIGSFKVSAITCEYPFSFTVDGQEVTATLVFTEKYESSISKVDYSTQHYVQKNLTLKDVTGMTGSDSEYKISNSNRTLKFLPNITTMYPTKEGAEDYINNIYKVRQCETIYYKEDTNFIKTKTTIGFSLKKVGDYENPLVSTTVIDNSQSSNNNNNNNSVNGGAEDRNGCSALGNEVVQMLRSIFKLIQVAGPLLAIIFGMFDFVGAVMSAEDGAMKKAGKKFFVRLIAAALLFLVPFLLDFLLQFIGYSDTVCVD